ncbi:recombinase family protein [Mycobacteroides abscessus]|uniref:recombinase family protein n=1 Tax=Mycobacteroides abscessus TaxID=36809 RepID=UPI001926551C|nr:recombinase family protein [Mycobacteroides abscessus]MBL3753006.1 recombinase family protein [Mycobacteroides abscessus subsp. massiliense]
MRATPIAAIYLRMSKESEEGIERQQEDCVALCKAKGWDWQIYTDDGFSATTGKDRPAWRKVRADIEAGQYDVLVAWKIDRLYRNPQELENEVLPLARSAKVVIWTHDGGEYQPDREEAVMSLRLQGAVGEFESSRKAARQRRAAKQRAKAGLPWWPSRPFGFAYTEGTQRKVKGELVYKLKPQKDENGNTLRDEDDNPIGIPGTETPVWEVPPRPELDDEGKAQLDPDEAALIKAAYEHVLAEGSLRAIAATWNEAGVTTPKGNTWTGAAVLRLLCNPRNAGLRTHGYRSTSGTRGLHVDDTTPEGNWPAIVDRDVFNGVVTILSNPQRSTTVYGSKYLMTGIALCGACEGPMAPGWTSGAKGKTKTKIYRCDACHKIVRNMDAVDALVIDRAVQRLSRDDARELLVHRKREDTTELRTQADVVRAKIQKVEQDYADELIEAQDLKARRDNLRAQLRVINSQLEDANRARVFEGFIGAKDVHAYFLAAGLDRQRAVINALMTVTILPTVKGGKFRDEHVRILPR